MNKKFIIGGTLIASAIIFSACGTANYYAETAETTALGKNVLVQPTLAQLDVTPTRATATLNESELTDLDLNKAKSTVCAKALKAGGADILVAPRYEMEYNAEKKLSKLLSPKRKVQFCKKKSTILAEFFFERTTCKVARCLFASFGCLHTNFALFN